MRPERSSAGGQKWAGMGNPLFLAGRMLTTREPSWQPLLATFAESAEGRALAAFLAREPADEVLPPRAERFAALELCPLPAVRVVIVGQDPYPIPGDACGLAFSVAPGVATPPSLENVFANLRKACDLQPPPSGDLRGWAQQGVLLLNRVQTVRAGAPGSHRGQGWEALADRILRAVSALRHPVAFLLWGREAREAVQAAGVDRARHTLLTTTHPSPKAAHLGFLKSRHFALVHELQDALGQPRTDWSRAYDPAAGPAAPVAENVDDAEAAEDARDEIVALPLPPAKRARTHVPPAALWVTGQPGVEQAAAAWLHACPDRARWAYWSVRGVVPCRARCLDGSRWPEAVTTHHMSAVAPAGHVAAELGQAWRAVLGQVRGLLVVDGPAAVPHPALHPVEEAAAQLLGAGHVHHVADVREPGQRAAAAAWLAALPAPRVAVTGPFALADDARGALQTLWEELFSLPQ